MITRRKAIMSTLFGSGLVGLRALATGLPASFLLNPRKALADMPDSGAPSCGSAAAAQYIIFNTLGSGDPINANVPGMYLDPKITHPMDPTMAPTSLSINGQKWTAAAPWASLPQNVLDRTVFWHIMTDTPIHPKEPSVLSLMDATANNEMFPSILAQQLTPCLNCVQPYPISLGADGPSEALSYQGQDLPIMPPTALQATLANPTGSPLTALQALRDQTLNGVNGQAGIYDLYKNYANPTQQAYIDAMMTSQQQVRNISQTLLSNLSSIKDNTAASQILAAITLIQMNVSAVIAIRIPFGGDNHRDPMLATETTETVAGVASIAQLMSQLQSAGLQDKVSFVTLDVFGRTVGPVNTDGRQHNPNHQVSLTIGKPFKGGVIGGVAPLGSDYGCLNVDPSTGAGTSSTSGTISSVNTLSAFGQTVLAAVGVSSATAQSQITISGPGTPDVIVNAALAS
jgi:hypothetical protein